MLRTDDHALAPCTPRTRRGLAPAVVWACVLIGPCAAPCVSAQAPTEDWRSLDTDHFRVTYPRGLRDLARQVADRAERAYRGLEDRFDTAPGADIDIVVTDHTDAANGVAGVVPWNRITIFAPPPMEGFELAFFDDWIELVVTHELAHIFHLDRRGPLGTLAKAIFGRAPVRWPIFPNSALPRWTVEGLATYYESSLTDAGRVRGTFHDMALRTAVLEGQFETLTQVSGETQVWPAGNRPYVYGSLFFDHLTQEHGADRMAEFARAVDEQIVPYRLNSAARDAFGVSFADAFTAWTSGLETHYAAVVADLTRRSPQTRGEPIATTGRWALYPKVAPDGATLAFARSDGSSDAQIHLTNPAGKTVRTLSRTNGLCLLDWTPDGRVVFSQVEFVDPYRSYKDLYVAHTDGGDLRRVTTGARLDYPSVSPDGARVLAVQQADGRTWIVVVDLATGDLSRLVEPTDDVHWAYPTWSPDGRWIAASRWEPGAFYDLVLLDAAGQTVHRVTHDRAIDLAPTWAPDGHRVLWASDRTGIPNLFAVDILDDGRVGVVRQVTNLATGGSYPDVDPSATWIYFSTYHADGWHVERIPYDPRTWLDPAPTTPRFMEGGQTAIDAYANRLGTRERSYTPFPSLWPRYWVPTVREGETRRGTQVLGPSIGVLTSAVDTVGRHAAAAAVSYEPRGRRFSGGLAYAFFGLGNPILSLSAEQRRASAGFEVEDPATDGETPIPRDLFLVTRERELRADVSVLRRRVRSTITVSVGASYVWEQQTLLDDTLSPDRVFVATRPTSGLPQVSATVNYDNTRRHPFSISAEDGIHGFTRVRRRWDPAMPDPSVTRPGVDAAWTDLTGEVKLYKAVRLPGFSNHVLAGRASGGAAWDSGADAFFYSIGGTTGQSERITGLELLRGSALPFPVRGYPWGIRSGTRAWSASAEYRFPLGRINRALGDVPLYADWMSGSLFLDAGNAWGPELALPRFDNPRRHAVASAGAELLLSGLPLWTTPTVLRTGLAFPLVEGQGATVYVRLGVPF